MKKDNDLQNMIYQMLLTQIELGVYHYHDKLPFIKEMSQYLHVSVETVRAAYNKLKKEQYITISKNVGSHVIVNYTQEEVDHHIQVFFAARKDALLDLSQSMKYLFNHAQLMSLKKASPQLLDELELLIKNRNIKISYRAIQFFLELYQLLESDVMVRLIWQIFLFFQIPFLDILKDIPLLEEKGLLLIEMIHLSRQKQWDKLQSIIDQSYDWMYLSISEFYEHKIQIQLDQSHYFTWNIYKKNEQKCYSVGLELIQDIQKGYYLEGTYLPSLAELSKEKKVSLSTIRRTITLLNKLGAVQSINGVGTLILSHSQSSDHCDFTQHIIHHRLSDFVQSLYICTLTCQNIIKVTFKHLPDEQMNQFVSLLVQLKNNNHCELSAYATIEYIMHYSPYQSIRTIYSHLFQQFLWGYPLHKSDNERLLSIKDTDELLIYLNQQNFSQFAKKVENILTDDLRAAYLDLKQLGIILPI